MLPNHNSKTHSHSIPRNRMVTQLGSILSSFMLKRLRLDDAYRFLFIVGCAFFDDVNMWHRYENCGRHIKTYNWPVSNISRPHSSAVRALCRYQKIMGSDPVVTLEFFFRLQSFASVACTLWRSVYSFHVSFFAEQVGPRSCGKTSLVHLVAQLTGNRLEVMAMNSAMDTTELLGGFEQVW